MAAGWVAAVQATGGPPAGVASILAGADDGPLGLLAPAQLAALAAAVGIAARRRRSFALTGSALAPGLLAAADAAALPARLGGLLAQGLGPGGVLGLAPAQVGKLLAAAPAGAALAVALARLAARRDEPARSVGAVLLRLLAGLGAVAVLSEAGAAWLHPGPAGAALLATCEEFVEALLSAWALAGVLTVLAPGERYCLIERQAKAPRLSSTSCAPSEPACEDRSQSISSQIGIDCFNAAGRQG